MYLYNAQIFTLDKKIPSASALAIRDGRIIALGSDAEIRGEFEQQMSGLNLHGQIVLPGLTDAHIHLEHYALGLQKVDCETSTRSECLTRVAARSQQVPAGEWVLGHGWNQNNWEDGYGTAAELDEVSPNNPAYLTAKSLHAAWVNTIALRLANLTRDTIDPAGGKLGRDESGNLNGILYESAMELVGDAAPEPSLDKILSALKLAQKNLWEIGITGVHDFDRRRCFQALQILHKNGELGLRVLKSIPHEDLPHAAELGLRSGFGDDVLRIGGVKMFADGALGPQTAAMLKPYTGSTDQYGFLLLDNEEIFENGKTAVDNGFSLAIHAIGDRANHEVIEALIQLRKYENSHLHRSGKRLTSQLRHRIEHVQLIHPDDASRLAEHGITASMQPIHASSDMEMADRYWGERTKFAYAWKTQLDAGANLAFGSDAPVESPNPFMGIHAAVTRQRLDGRPGPGGWNPQQRISLFDALRAYTIGPAKTAGWDDRLGCLIPGSYADLIVLDRNPFQIPPDELADLSPTFTMMNGEWVFNK